MFYAALFRPRSDGLFVSLATRSFVRLDTRSTGAPPRFHHRPSAALISLGDGELKSVAKATSVTGWYCLSLHAMLLSHRPKPFLYYSSAYYIIVIRKRRTPTYRRTHLSASICYISYETRPPTKKYRRGEQCSVAEYLAFSAVIEAVSHSLSRLVCLTVVVTNEYLLHRGV